MATKTRQQKKHASNGDKQNMLDLAAKIEDHYTRPSPQATPDAPTFFPTLLNTGILLGLLLGALAGLVFGLLLQNGSLAPRGWEGLFSLGPFTFYSFWVLTGAALGLAIGGVATLLMAPVPDVKPPQD